MKILLVLVVLVVLFIALRTGIHYVSAGKATPGLTNGQLAPCPDKPNCHATRVVIGESSDTAIEKLQSLIEAINGTSVVLREPGYLHATFKTRVMGFTDDFEIQAVDDNTLQFRSASRIGHSDLGANKKRVLKLLDLAGLTASAG